MKLWYVLCIHYLMQFSEKCVELDAIHFKDKESCDQKTKNKRLDSRTRIRIHIYLTIKYRLLHDTDIDDYIFFLVLRFIKHLIKNFY
jgi:hypothetical protein